MNKDEALRHALEALENIDRAMPFPLVKLAIEECKAALKTKDEPVAWMNRHGACKTSLFREMEAGAKEEYTIPVYTTPQRKPLRDEQIRDIAKQYALSLAFPSNSQTTPEMFARAIEAAHGIKE